MEYNSFLPTSTGRQIRFPRNRIKGNGINFYAPGYEVVYQKVIQVTGDRGDCLIQVRFEVHKGTEIWGFDHLIEV